MRLIGELGKNMPTGLSRTVHMEIGAVREGGGGKGEGEGEKKEREREKREKR